MLDVFPLRTSLSDRTKVQVEIGQVGVLLKADDGAHILLLGQPVNVRGFLQKHHAHFESMKLAAENIRNSSDPN